VRQSYLRARLLSGDHLSIKHNTMQTASRKSYINTRRENRIKQRKIQHASFLKVASEVAGAHPELRKLLVGDKRPSPFAAELVLVDANIAANSGLDHRKLGEHDLRIPGCRCVFAELIVGLLGAMRGIGNLGEFKLNCAVLSATRSSSVFGT
jgi:hypothetical protein